MVKTPDSSEDEGDATEDKPVIRKGVDIELVDVIHPLKYMIDMSRNLIN